MGILGGGTLGSNSASSGGGGGISNVVEDTTPELGGNLDVLAKTITSSTANVTLDDAVDITGALDVTGAITGGGTSIGLGDNYTSSGTGSIALGGHGTTGATASATGSIAIGGNNATQASASANTGTNTIAVGSGSTATGTSALAVGLSSVSSASGAIALGTNTDSTGTGAISIGSYTQALAEGAVVIGGTDSNFAGAYAEGVEAIVVGAGATTNSARSIAIGKQSFVGDGSMDASEALAPSDVGAGYATDSVKTAQATTSSGSGTGMTLTYTTASGVVTGNMTVVAVGSGYLPGEVVTVTNTDSATTDATVTLLASDFEVDTAVDAIAIGGSANAMADASCQIGPGTNAVANTCQISNMALNVTNGNIQNTTGDLTIDTSNTAAADVILQPSATGQCIVNLDDGVGSAQLAIDISGANIELHSGNKSFQFTSTSSYTFSVAATPVLTLTSANGVTCQKNLISVGTNDCGTATYPFTNLHITAAANIGGAITHTGTTVGLYSTTPVAQASALTAALTTITNAGTASDYAIQAMTNTTPYGFVTQAEAETLVEVVLNNQARINEIETALANIGITA